MKADIHPNYVDRPRYVLVRQHVHDPLDQGRAARRALQRVPPLLHGQAEAGRHRRPRRALRAPLRPAQGRARPAKRDARPAAPQRAAGREARSPRPRAAGEAPVVSGLVRRRRRRCCVDGRPGCWPTSGPSGPSVRPWRGPASRVPSTVRSSPTTPRRRHAGPAGADFADRRRSCGWPRAGPAPADPGAARASAARGRRRCWPGARDRGGRRRAGGRARRARRRGGRARGVPGGARSRPGAARLEVGVGAHDREAFALVHGDLPTVEALAGVVASWRRYRRPGADPTR